MMRRNPVTLNAVQDIISSCLRGKVTKDVARRVDVTPRTILNWAGRATEPTATQLIALMAEYDQIADGILALIGRQRPAAQLSKTEIDTLRHAAGLLQIAFPEQSEKESRACRLSQSQFTNGVALVRPSMQSVATSF